MCDGRQQSKIFSSPVFIKAEEPLVWQGMPRRMQRKLTLTDFMLLSLSGRPVYLCLPAAWLCTLARLSVFGRRLLCRPASRTLQRGSFGCCRLVLLCLYDPTSYESLCPCKAQSWQAENCWMTATVYVYASFCRQCLANCLWVICPFETFCLHDVLYVHIWELWRGLTSRARFAASFGSNLRGT